MKKQSLAIIFGGMSTEHDVSIVSGTSVLSKVNKNKYNVSAIYIDKNGNWYKYKDLNKQFNIGESITNIEKIENVMDYLKHIDIVFPILHGLYGEDGTIQGLFELLKIPYIGCKVLGSSVGMDKVYTKIIFEKAKINQAKYEYIRKNKYKYIYIDKNFNEKEYELINLCEILSAKIGFPMFIKPSNSGSSVGINKAKNEAELIKYIEYASNFDNKILIEQCIIGREIECAVLGNEEVISSCVGEIIPAEEFYSFDAKYKNVDSKLCIPADLPIKISDKIRALAIKAFKSIDGKGLARVDFFVENNTNKIYINEINTMPGFTSISMYPKLWENSGIEYKDLLEKLINLAVNNN